MTKLYHKDIGFPFKVTLPKILSLSYSSHAIRAAENDKYGRIFLEPFYSTEKAELIEMETIGNSVAIKVVLRKPYTEKLDLCTVIALGDMIVKTVWLNRNNDSHFTLNYNKYEQVMRKA